MLIASQPPPPSGPRAALHLIALLATRQGTDLSNENKVLIRCAWEGIEVDDVSVFDDEYGSGWASLGACPSPSPSPPPPSPSPPGTNSNQPSPPPPSPSPPSTPREMRRQLNHGEAFNTNISGHLTGIIVMISPFDVIDVLAPWNVGVVQTQYGGSPYKFVEEIVRPLLCSPRVRPQPHCHTCQNTRACMHVHTHTGDRCEQDVLQMVLGRTQHHLAHHWTH